MDNLLITTTIFAFIAIAFILVSALGGNFSGHAESKSKIPEQMTAANICDYPQIPDNIKRMIEQDIKQYANYVASIALKTAAVKATVFYDRHSFDNETFRVATPVVDMKSIIETKIITP